MKPLEDKGSVKEIPAFFLPILLFWRIFIANTSSQLSLQYYLKREEDGT